MDIIQYFQKLVSYDEWANNEFATALKVHSIERSQKLLSHVLSAERLWLDRIEQRTQTMPVWPDLSPSECEREIKDLAGRWRSRLNRGANLSTEVTYKNSKGEQWTSREDDIFLHVIVHSAYHRGQIAADLRAAGFQPPYTDFIHGVRQGLLR